MPDITKQRKHHLIGDSKLSRMERDFTYPNSINRYRCDHSSLLAEVRDPRDSRKVTVELLIDAHKEPYHGAARSLQHCDTLTLKELLRGYRLAKEANLLGESFDGDEA